MTSGLNQATEPADAKTAYAQAVAAKDVPSMLAYAQRLLSNEPSLATAQRIVNTLPFDLPGRPAVRSRIAIFRSFTIETSIPFLRALAALHGIDLTVRVGE